MRDEASRATWNPNPNPNPIPNLNPNPTPNLNPNLNPNPNPHPHPTTLTLTRRYFTSHDTLARLKQLAEASPLYSSFALPTLRREFGLHPVDTWPTLLQHDVPLVIPMRPGTFARPSDWPPRTVCTDFISLRAPDATTAAGTAPPQLAAEIVDFVARARRAPRRLVLMTFSSMPVPRRRMLKVCIRMTSQSRHQLSVLFVGKR